MADAGASTVAAPQGNDNDTINPSTKRSVRVTLRFVLTFCGLVGVLLGVYYFPYAADSAMHRLLVGYLEAYTSVAGALLQLVEPGLVVSGQELVGRYAIKVVKTCDGMDVNILLFCAIMAWPTSLRRRIWGVMTGIAVLVACNTLRICTLYLIGVYAANAFEFAHLELWPAIILLVAIILFWRFAYSAPAPHAR